MAQIGKVVAGDWGNLERIINRLNMQINQLITASVTLAFLIDGSRSFTGQYFYLKGDVSTNGSIRLNITTDRLIIEHRVTGTWMPIQEWP